MATVWNVRSLSWCKQNSRCLFFFWQASVHISKETRSNHGGHAGHTKGKGAAIMKTVSILLVNSRRVCNQRKCQRDKSDGRTARRRIGSKKMDEGAGKLNTKLLESLKKKTHFSK